MDAEGLEELREEVSGLRRRLRRHQVGSLGLQTVWALLLLISLFRSDFPELRTERLQVMRGDQVVLELEPGPSGSGTLSTFDERGFPLVEISRTTSAGTLTTFHGDGGVLLELSNTENGGYLATYGNGGEPLVRLSRTGYGGDLSVFSKGQVSAALTTLANGGAQRVHSVASANLLP